ncbi:hypothetical protein GJV85_04380 [Sulfurimonas aquatica]|uniref:Uncharacterized protein n=1 Tax=Sulfurimonas aquatica TaxID=2672570 RepID=A0A975AZJ1_9BACT|nr:hypothetical protein [Sulfurimonas aquatica]QSZ41373.1 hypothetical protein GJV85_04380 [Sulfurimonas aquatica]
MLIKKKIEEYTSCKQLIEEHLEKLENHKLMSCKLEDVPSSSHNYIYADGTFNIMKVRSIVGVGEKTWMQALNDILPQGHNFSSEYNCSGKRDGKNPFSLAYFNASIENKSELGQGNETDREWAVVEIDGRIHVRNGKHRTIIARALYCLGMINSEIPVNKLCKIS